MNISHLTQIYEELTKEVAGIANNLMELATSETIDRDDVGGEAAKLNSAIMTCQQKVIQLLLKQPPVESQDA